MAVSDTIVGAVIAVALGGLAMAPAAAFGWRRDALQPPVSAIIRRAVAPKIVQTPKVSLLQDGELAVILTHNNYASDAVVSAVELESFVSRDGGSTWERRQPTSPDWPPILHNYPSPPLRLKDGTLIAIGSRAWENFPDTPQTRQRLAERGFYLFTHEEGNAPGVVSIIHRVWMRRSNDAGKTWQESGVELPSAMPHLALYGDATLLRDGTIVQPAWGRFDLRRAPKHVSSLALHSEDGGAHWSISVIAKARDFDFNETSIVETANGDLVALMRIGGQRELWGALSHDGGKTWSEPRDTALLGSTPWLVMATDGVIVAVYVRRGTHAGAGAFARTGIFACVSRDHGRTWDARNQSMLVDCGTEVVDGYPSSAALPDGAVYTVYGFHGSSAIGGTRFRARGPQSEVRSTTNAPRMTSQRP